MLSFALTFTSQVFGELLFNRGNCDELLFLLILSLKND